jgi:peptidoglycan hydrolase-like protein with peptidoglycan-binding domain
MQETSSIEGRVRMSDQKKLFPEFLDKGSRGPAVAVLQLLLKIQDFDLEQTIVVDGDYGDMTAAGVQRLQEYLQIEQDGNFGPATREAFQVEFAFDLNLLLHVHFQGETVEAQT